MAKKRWTSSLDLSIDQPEVSSLMERHTDCPWATPAPNNLFPEVLKETQ